MLGQRLFPLLREMFPNYAPKLTGMLLEINNSELLDMLADQHLLKSTVNNDCIFKSITPVHITKIIMTNGIDFYHHWSHPKNWVQFEDLFQISKYFCCYPCFILLFLAKSFNKAISQSLEHDTADGYAEITVSDKKTDWYLSKCSVLARAFQIFKQESLINYINWINSFKIKQNINVVTFCLLLLRIVEIFTNSLCSFSLWQHFCCSLKMLLCVCF